MRFFAAYPDYPGLSLDIESLNDDAMPAYLSFIQELYASMHPRNLQLYVNVAASTPDSQLKTDCGQLRRHCADELRRARGEQRSGAGGQPELVCGQPAAGAEDGAQGEDHLRGGQLRLRLDAVDSQPEGPQASRSRRCWIRKTFRSRMHGSARRTPMPTWIWTTTR